MWVQPLLSTDHDPVLTECYSITVDYIGTNFIEKSKFWSHSTLQHLWYSCIVARLEISSPRCAKSSERFLPKIVLGDLYPLTLKTANSLFQKTHQERSKKPKKNTLTTHVWRSQFALCQRNAGVFARNPGFRSNKSCVYIQHALHVAAPETYTSPYRKKLHLHLRLRSRSTSALTL